MKARLPYVPAYVREWWDPDKNVHLRDQTADLKDGQQTLFRIYKRMIPQLKKARVPLLTGSDMGGNPHCFAGWGVHDEMALLVEAGLTPMEAIVAATSNPARYLHVFEKQGSVEKGKTADFVVLTADPLTDIHNTQAIDSVVYGGKLIGPQDRKSLWAKQKAATAKRL
jgi:imidazolonepropionase-like amidohydrolase